MISESTSFVEVHSKKYKLPIRPTVVVCIDGFDPTYLGAGIEDGILPNMARFSKQGFHVIAKSAMPSLTNPNNASIITGVPPAVHGIAGNFFIDPETKEEHMVLDDTYLRGPTILEKMANRGIRVATVTAKDKLRKILKHGLEGSICFSAQYADKCTIEENGIEGVENWLGRKVPPQYSGDLSLFALDAGVKLLEEDRADLMYLTLSDFIQHKFAPRSKESDDFLSAVDARLGKLVQLGAIVAVTGDHGMSDKCGSDGKPNVIFLEDELNQKFGEGSVRVMTPITDPFPGHHGGIGSFVRVHFLKPLDLKAVIEYCESFPQVQEACPREEAAIRYETPLDRESEVVVVSIKHAGIGSRRDEHDMSNIEDHRLRSHGGWSEQEIPLLRSTPVTGVDIGGIQWRNFSAFDLVLNYA